ncbi:DUF397 domain-containing protein [Streptomyces misionensis]|uniref:DUF397 domain-containing protein n=1 Tax=Streptomyces misionensis TaxID=67331 RepID=UPI0036A1ECA5
MSAHNPNNLYGRQVVGEFSYLCTGNGTEENMESCIALAPLAGGGFALRDTKAEGAGQELRGSAAELLNLAEHIRNTVTPDSTV